MKRIIWDEVVIKKKIKIMFSIFCLIHILTADYETNGILAIQPFSIKNLFFGVMFVVTCIYAIREGKKGNVSNSYIVNRMRVAPFAYFVLTPILVALVIFLVFVFPKLLGYECFDQIPTLWLGFKP